MWFVIKQKNGNSNERCFIYDESESGKLMMRFSHDLECGNLYKYNVFGNNDGLLGFPDLHIKQWRIMVFVLCHRLMLCAWICYFGMGALMSRAWVCGWRLRSLCILIL